MNWRLLSDSRCLLGEGVHWHQRSGQVMWVDIHGCAVYALDLVSGCLSSWRMPQRIGWLIPKQHDLGFVAGFQGGFVNLELGDSGAVVWSWLHQPFEGRSSLRLNDAKADADGRIWAGSMNNDDDTRPDGALFCLKPDGQLEEMDKGYRVANGPAISPDGQLLFHTDSALQKIYAFDLDKTTGTLGNKRVWKVLGADEGYPDGMNFDAQGCLWLAHWGAGLVSRYSIDGTLLSRFKLPVSQVTNVAFGGPQLDRLFVSTARVGLSEQQLAIEPLAGGLFELLEHGASGLLPHAFAG